MDLAERIVDDLFTNGFKESGHRLVITDTDGRNLGGWGRQAATERVRTLLPAASGWVEVTEDEATWPPDSDHVVLAEYLMLDVIGVDRRAMNARAVRTHLRVMGAKSGCTRWHPWPAASAPKEGA